MMVTFLPLQASLSILSGNNTFTAHRTQFTLLNILSFNPILL
jgi:hypothetical protein